jgi:hypothetical protein
MLLAACSGSSTKDAVGAAGASLAKIHSGTLHLKLALATGTDASAATVGFQMDGPFDLTPAGAPLPVADLTTVEAAAAPSKGTTRFLSTGHAAFIVVGGVAYQLTDQQLARLEPASGSPAASGSASSPLAGIDLSTWVVDPASQPATTVNGERVERITGKVDPVAALNGIVTMATQLGNAGGTELLVSDADAPRVRAAATSSTFEVTTGSDDHLLRTFTATVEFAVPAASSATASSSSSGSGAVLRQLGQLGHLTLTIELRIERPNTAVTVQPPTDIRPIDQLPKS